MSQADERPQSPEDAYQGLEKLLAEMDWASSLSPGEAETAPNADLLAAYLERTLPPREREEVEAFLARNPQALEGLLSAWRRKEALAAGWQPAPAQLREKARALKPRRAALKAPSLWSRLRGWAEGWMPAPRWALAAIPVCAVLLISSYLLRAQLAGMGGAPAGERAVVRWTLPLSSSLEGAIQTYQAKPTQEAASALVEAVWGSLEKEQKGVHQESMSLRRFANTGQIEVRGLAAAARPPQVGKSKSPALLGEKREMGRDSEGAPGFRPQVIPSPAAPPAPKPVGSEKRRDAAAKEAASRKLIVTLQKEKGLVLEVVEPAK